LIAKLGELPREFEKKVKSGFEGMIIFGLLSIIFATTSPYTINICLLLEV